ncbi:MAG: hypothetical protein R6U84_08440 [Candidatus Cloacimonadales bacterium]
MKEKYIEIDNQKFLRQPIKTEILNATDDIVDVVRDYAAEHLEPGDTLVISESPLAITQGRAVPVEQIKLGILARLLWRFVSKVEYGIGLRAPESMQCAIDECGRLRILLAALIGGLGRLVGRRGKGDFYRIAGKQAALIDAATTSPVPPYEKCVIKGPKNPARVAQRISDAFRVEVAIMDINDIGGCWMVGGSKQADKQLLEQVMKDNPQGQGAELTPFCIVRKIS